MLILDAFTAIATFGGGMLNWNFTMAGTASTDAMWFVIAILLILAWKTADRAGSLAAAHGRPAAAPRLCDGVYGASNIGTVLNAIDTVPDGGTLTVRIVAAPTLAIIKIQNTGIGIPPTSRAHVFEPFWTDKPNHRTRLIDQRPYCDAARRAD